MKEIFSKKRNSLKDLEIVTLTKECSALVQKKLLQKLKYSKSFTIPCTISKTSFDTVLCNLDTNIDLMPFFIYKKLGIGEVKPTNISFQLVNRSLIHPYKIVKDILIKVDKFIFLANFMMLYMKDDHNIPLIFR